MILDIQKIYDKFNDGDPITDEELAYSLSFFSQLSSMLIRLGPVFRLSWLEADKVAMRLASYKRAREGSDY